MSPPPPLNILSKIFEQNLSTRRYSQVHTILLFFPPPPLPFFSLFFTHIGVFPKAIKKTPIFSSSPFNKNTPTKNTLKEKKVGLKGAHLKPKLNQIIL